MASVSTQLLMQPDQSINWQRLYERTHFFSNAKQYYAGSELTLYELNAVPQSETPNQKRVRKKRKLNKQD